MHDPVYPVRMRVLEASVSCKTLDFCRHPNLVCRPYTIARRVDLTWKAANRPYNRSLSVRRMGY